VMKKKGTSQARLASALAFLGLPILTSRSFAQDVTVRMSVDSNGVEGNDHSTYPSISADGRHVAFYGGASNLVYCDRNGAFEIFVHDRLAGTTVRVSVSSAGVQANYGSFLPSISADGRFVAFESYATNLVSGDGNGVEDIFVHDRDPD